MTIIANFTSTVQILSVELKRLGIHDRFLYKKKLKFVGGYGCNPLVGLYTVVTLLNPTGGIC